MLWTDHFMEAQRLKNVCEDGCIPSSERSKQLSYEEAKQTLVSLKKLCPNLHLFLV
jgi:hypothetical protein